MSPAPVRIRFGIASDIPELLEYERRFFPAVAGQRHAGYVYEETALVALTLTEHIAVPRRSFTIVAEADDKIVGFAAALPSRFPGTGQFDPTSMILHYLAVDPDRRREGIATALISEIEKRSLGARQNVIIAHVPHMQADFYRVNGWEVFTDGRGYAWLPFNDHLRADVGDPEIGFPLMAAKVLRPRAIRHTFDFPIVRNLPVFDASAELTRIVDAGLVDAGNLDEKTRFMLDVSRRDRGARAH